ncbi:YcaQ family DNA glycosylase [Paenibacillus sp. MWE-103]|uniref:YcaQ family DNA glycosylase n=1 Tax=Paenibacillus artemisiicola TaxID=1172618 RepID=A0ABS3W368_9BACL|nr:crosslink repair DNA glycosylase YcaQ family protein [Paenibacillus artemisiicola]MBO7742730.1 YcaQ family DNA glycosylase [Paenibacillus artemisiicola]
MKPIRTTKRALRRLLLERQLLLGPPAKRARSAAELRRHVVAALEALECVQIDPVAAVRPNQHLALAARIAGYEPRVLNGLLRDKEAFEYFANAACIIPLKDYAMFEPVRQRMRARTRDAIEGLRSVVDDVLRKLEAEGPLPAKAFESEERVHGYWDNVAAKTKATSHALNLLMDASFIRIVGREGNQRLFDVSSRSVPEDLLREAETIGPEEASDRMLRKYFRAYRVFEPSDARFGWQRFGASERREALERYVRAGEAAPVEIDGLKQPYFILTEDAELLERHREAEEGLREDEGPVRFLPPLDNLLWSRKRLEDLFGFAYRWEIYTPAVKRTYGYYAMPILAGDRLIGRMDPRLDAKRKHLTVELLHIEPEIRYTAKLRRNVERALDAFARAHGAETVSVERQAIGQALRP